MPEMSPTDRRQNSPVLLVKDRPDQAFQDVDSEAFKDQETLTPLTSEAISQINQSSGTGVNTNPPSQTSHNATARSQSPPARLSSAPPLKHKNMSPTWTCEKCDLINQSTSSECEACFVKLHVASGLSAPQTQSMQVARQPVRPLFRKSSPYPSSRARSFKKVRRFWRNVRLFFRRVQPLWRWAVSLEERIMDPGFRTLVGTMGAITVRGTQCMNPWKVLFLWCYLSISFYVFHRFHSSGLPLRQYLEDIANRHKRISESVEPRVGGLVMFFVSLSIMLVLVSTKEFILEVVTLLGYRGSCSMSFGQFWSEVVEPMTRLTEIV